MREVLRLKNVEKSLHADKVLRNVNLQIFAGNWWACLVCR